MPCVPPDCQNENFGFAKFAFARLPKSGSIDSQAARAYNLLHCGV
jgi:hypothetical protein